MLQTGKFSKTVSSTGKPQASFRYLAKGTWYVAVSYTHLLQDKDIYLRLSAGLLYSFSNLTLGNPAAAKMGFRNIQECLHLSLIHI